jgi:tRNA dimethylallyltransferase
LSRQVYKYLDIGTSKPAWDIRKKIKHHFVDILEPDQYYSAGEFGEEARKVIEEIFLKDRIPFIVGGSGLYIKALLEGFFPNNIRDDNVRNCLKRRIEKEGSNTLYQELKIIDPDIAQKIHPNNTHRIIRALEVFKISGKQMSELQALESIPTSFNVIKFALTKKRAALYADINLRVDQMLEEGLLSEVAKILEMGFEKRLNSLNTVGYKEVIEYFEGNYSYEECVALIKRNSRQYAKRQYTWFNTDKEIQWITLDETLNYFDASLEIVDKYKNFYK